MESVTDKAHGRSSGVEVYNSPFHPKLVSPFRCSIKLHVYINPVNECLTTLMTA